MISILTTVKGGYEFLEECAKSIFLQHCVHGELTIEWEWWIGINGWGEDGGEAYQVARKIQQNAAAHRVHVVNMPEVNGRVEALNTLCGKVSGEWIAILDCDDTWEQDKLLTQMSAIQMSSRPIDIIGTHCSYSGDVGGAPVLPSGWISLESVLASNPIINSSVLLRRDIAIWEDRCGLEDYDLWIRAAKAGRGLFNVPHPLVRHRIHSRSAFNGTGEQNLEGLRAVYGICAPTVVTAYYPIQSKFSVKEYMKWIIEFWPRVPCALVFYTEPGLVSMFEEIFANRERTKVIGIPFCSLAANQKLGYRVWEQTRALDKEVAHTPQLYALWYEKKEFILRTIEANPFCSDTFVWCDAGIGRVPEFIPNLQRFPLRGLIPRGKMLILEIDPLKKDDCGVDEWGIPGRFDDTATFGGGILASDKEGWLRWSKTYDAMLARYHLAGRFIGKDQNIMASMILEEPNLAAIVQRPPSLGPIVGWFYLLLFLSGIQVS